MRDDCLHETDDVKEAIQRLPGDLYDARQFRISRAMYLSNRKEILPKDEWTKMEDVSGWSPLSWYASCYQGCGPGILQVVFHPV